MPWSRVIVESVVIVFSILIAFAIDASWDSRQDRIREREYLALLVSDLESTLENNRFFGEIATSVVEPATAALVRAYYAPGPVAADSLAWWFDRAVGLLVVQPRLGTAQTLVSTGDLSLIRSDSMRVAIRDYLTSMNFFDQAQGGHAEAHQVAADELSRRVNLAEVRLSVTSAAARDSLAAADLLFPFPAGRLLSSPQVDLEAAMRDPDVHAILYRMLGSKRLLRNWRTLMERRSMELLERVKAFSPE